MDLREKLPEFITRIENLKDTIETEEATKTSLIMPFFQMLGYDVFNPLEFIPEYTADVGIKKGEKVDYAIVIDGEPVILIECKPCNTNITKYTSQLFRYFSTTTAKFAILTNGIEYKFFTDLEDINKMDTVPFLDINLLKLKERDIVELSKFSKEILDIDNILNSAENLKYGKLVKDWIDGEFVEPSADFVRLIINDIYDGVKTQRVVDNFTPIVKKVIQQYINDKINEKLKIALNDNEQQERQEAEVDTSEEKKSKINTTIVELEAYAIIKSILRKVVNVDRIFYRDTQSYFGVLLDDNNRKWICRIHLDGVQYFTVPDENKNDIRYDIDSIDDLYKHADIIIAACKRYL